MLISQIKENMRHGEMNVTLQLLEKAIKNDPINEVYKFIIYWLNN